MTAKKTAAKPPRGAGGAIKWKAFEEPEEVYVPLSKLEGVHQADAAGYCDRCQRSYRKGDWLFRSEGTLVAVNCCGAPEDVAAPTSLGDLTDAEDINGTDWVPLNQVLPLGRTKADMCQRCFQIPASNGVCGCS
jgi:hypothetical protein